MRPSRCATRTPAASRLAQPKPLRHERGGGANRREAAAPSESERRWGPASIRIDRPSARARRAATPSSDGRGRIRSNRSGGARSTRRPRRASRGMPRRWRHRAGGTPDSSRRLYYNRARMTPVWGLLAAAALLWPDRISGPFDGVPLDRVAEAIAAAVVFPILWWLHPRFLTTRIARVAMTVQGFLHARAAGLLNIGTGPDVAASISVDGHAVDGSAPLAAGIHSVFMDGVLTGDRWSLVPTWNGEELWSAVTTTVGRPSSLDLFVRPWVRFVPSTIVVVLLSSWAITAAMWIGDPIVVLWSALSSGVIGWLVLSGRAPIARAVIPALLLAAWLTVPPRLRNRRGAFLLVGIPWLTYAAACASTAIGRFVFYGSGHDTWMLQRFAYRIVMQGYWLEGGAP